MASINIKTWIDFSNAHKILLLRYLNILAILDEMHRNCRFTVVRDDTTRSILNLMCYYNLKGTHRCSVPNLNILYIISYRAGFHATFFKIF